jgi:hypothetical protein
MVEVELDSKTRGAVHGSSMLPRVPGTEQGRIGYNGPIMAPPPRTPHPRLVASTAPYLAGAQPEHVFVAQVGGNPAFAIAALPLGIVSLLIPTGSTAGVAIAVVVSAVFVAWVLAVFVPMQSRVVAVTRKQIVVLDATKLRFEPKSELRRLPRSHRFGEVKGFLTGRVDFGDGERAWVYKGYAGTIDVVDRRAADVLPKSVGITLPPRQRLTDWFRRDR